MLPQQGPGALALLWPCRCHSQELAWTQGCPDAADLGGTRPEAGLWGSCRGAASPPETGAGAVSSLTSFKWGRGTEHCRGPNVQSTLPTGAFEVPWMASPSLSVPVCPHLSVSLCPHLSVILEAIQ